MKYLPSYRCQLEALSLPDGPPWQLCILEGDSTDGSWEYLVRWASEDDRIIIGRKDVSAPGIGENPQDRAEQWALAANACLDLLTGARQYSHVLWMESDLCFPLDTVSRLLSCNVDIVAPLIWLGGLFYDTWGFRDLSGKRWSNSPPYHPAYRINALLEMGSVGSCVLLRREVLDSGVRFRGPYETGLLVGVCNDARKNGFHVFADTSTAVMHPVSLWEDQMWKVSGVEILEGDGTVRSLSTAQAFQLGWDRNIVILEAEFLVSSQRLFFQNVFEKWKTNRLHIQILKANNPSRLYRMTVFIGKREGVLFHIPRLAKRLIRACASAKFNVRQKYGKFYIYSGNFPLNLKISIEILADPMERLEHTQGE